MIYKIRLFKTFLKNCFKANYFSECKVPPFGRDLGWAALFLISFNLQSQAPWLLNNVPAQTFTGSFASGTITKSACNAELNPLNISTVADYDIKARNYIHVPAGNHSLAVSFSSGGSFHAHIEPAPFEVVSYYPDGNGFTNVKQYDKFELGVKLPQNLTDSIKKFFGAVNTEVYGPTTTTYNCTNGYGNKFDTNYINPYNPDQISVEATFHFPNMSDQTIYGFYYREYSYSTGTATPTYSSTNWVEDTVLQYHWRVRYAPKYVGTYTVTWKVKRNNQIVLQDSIGQNFTTISSTDRGFLKMGVNNKFLVTQPDSTQAQQTIVPIGTCNNTPPDAFLTGADSLPPGDCNFWGCQQVYFPSRYWRHRKKIRTTIAEQGGNIVRIFNSPDGYLFEWEKAGVYDASPTHPLGEGIAPSGPVNYYKGTNRQSIMWEFDRMLDMAKDNNIYIQWATENNSNGFIIDPGTSGYHWQGDNPYYSIIASPNPTAINQYFTDPAAIKMYKKRLRYMISRFGYSPNIGVLELVNEIQQYRYYIADGTTLDDVFKNWLDTMTNYIESSPPTGLGHNDHLMTVSIEPSDLILDPKLKVDSICSNSPKLDFLSRHPYFYDKNKNRSVYSLLNNFKTLYGKPCQAGELGLQSSWSCNDKFGLKLEYLKPTFHSILWSTAFVGGLTSGLDNWDGGLDIDPNIASPYNCFNGYQTSFAPVQAFIAGYNFDQENYVPKYVSPNDSIEAFYLQDNNGSSAEHAMGYVRNRTFFWYNFTQPVNNAGFYDTLVKKQFDTLVAYSCDFGVLPLSPSPVATGNLGTLSITGFSPTTVYDVDWYETFSYLPVQDPFLATFQFTTNVSGTGTITPPAFSSCVGQEYAFKIHLPGQPRPANPHPVINKYDTLSVNTTREVQKTKIAKAVIQELSTKFNIYPNPGNGIYIVEGSKDDSYLIEVLNAYGAIVKSLTFKGKQQEVNIQDLSNGLYTFTIKSTNGNYAKKIIKQ